MIIKQKKKKKKKKNMGLKYHQQIYFYYLLPFLYICMTIIEFEFLFFLQVNYTKQKY